MAAFGAEDVFLEKLILVSHVKRNVSVLLSDILIIWLCAVSFSAAPPHKHQHRTAAMAASVANRAS